MASVVLVLMNQGCSGEKARNPYAPADLKQAGTPKPIKVGNKLRVRVWADAAYRRESLGWRSDLDRMLAGANSILEERFSVSIEVVDANPWNREGNDDDLVQVLRDLEHHDDGHDADVVIGLVSALPVFPSSLHAVGMAHLFGRHLVLRGMHDVRDRDVMEGVRRKHGLVDAALGNDNAFAGEDVYLARVRHREIVAVLHELGHVLGLIHLQRSTDFMNPFWDPSQCEFAPENARLFELSLTELLRVRRGKEASFDELIAYLENTNAPRWDHGDRAMLLAWLRRAQQVGVDRAGRGTSTATIAQFVEPPAPGQEENATCMKLIDASAHAEGAIGPCMRAMELRPDDPFTALNLANAAERAGDHTRFEAALDEARGRLDRRGSQDAWLYYAKLCRVALRLSEAEESAGKAGQGGEEITRWATDLRAKTGLHRDEARSGVPRAKESDYLRRVAPQPLHDQRSPRTRAPRRCGPPSAGDGSARASPRRPSRRAAARSSSIPIYGARGWPRRSWPQPAVDSRTRSAKASAPSPSSPRHAPHGPRSPTGTNAPGRARRSLASRQTIARGLARSSMSRSELMLLTVSPTLRVGAAPP